MSQESQPWIVEVSEADVESQVLQRSRNVPVVLDIWAPWCGPCKQLGPVLESLADEHQGAFVLAKLNADEAPKLVEALRVQSIPTVVAFMDGQVVDGFTGALPEDQVRQFIERLLPTESEKLVEEAAETAREDAGDAVAKYEKALAEDPKNQEAAAALAALVFQQGDVDRAENLLADIPAGSDDAVEGTRARIRFEREKADLPDLAACRAQAQADPNDLEARYRLACRLAADGAYDQALETLLAIVRADKRFGEGRVRDAMVAIFHILGSTSDVVNQYRRELALLLY